MPSMRVLLLYPPAPETFWSFKHVLPFVSKRAAFPPLGLLTVAALLPADWDLRLVDLNVEPLSDDDLRWADYVMLSAMIVHQAAVADLVQRRLRRWGGRRDLNPRQPDPQSGALTKLSYDHHSRR